MACDQRIVVLDRTTYVALQVALRPEERWSEHNETVDGPNVVLFCGYTGYRKLIFVPRASPPIPDVFFKDTPMFSRADRLWAKLSVVECGKDTDGMPFVRPPHPIDWILRPFTRWRK